MSEFGRFLTGQIMTEHKLDSVVVTIDFVRELSQFDNRIVIDFTEPVAGECTALPLNTTNHKRLRRMFGNSWQEWYGKNIELRRYMTRNPKTGEDTYGIYIEDGTGVPDFSAINARREAAGGAAAPAAKIPARYKPMAGEAAPVVWDEGSAPAGVDFSKRRKK